jgi:teichuronic acid biosynthesis glycosyltransferase TuaG
MSPLLPSQDVVPRVTVVIPTYNRAHIVGEAIQSVLDQAYPNLELIVVDDGSIDDTERAVAPYLGRIIFLRKPNGGPASARNHGIAAATGEYVAFLDSDDLYLPGKLARQVCEFEEDPERVLVYCWFLISDGDGRLRMGRRCRLAGSVYRELLGECMKGPIYPSAAMIRRTALEQAGPFDETMRIADDTDLFCRLARLGPVGLIAEPLVQLRRFGDNVSRGPGRARYFALTLRILEKAFAADRGLGLWFRLKLYAKVWYWSWLVGIGGILPKGASFWLRALWTNPRTTLRQIGRGAAVLSDHIAKDEPVPPESVRRAA